jgi:hypothetical protein
MVEKTRLKLAAAFKPLLTRFRKFNINKLKDKDSKKEFVQHLTHKITQLDIKVTQGVSEKMEENREYPQRN